MSGGGMTISAQMRIGDSELTSRSLAELLAKIDVAQSLAGLTRLVLLPSRSAETNAEIIAHCRKSGIEAYLWYKVLADNDIIAEQSEIIEDAWGKKRVGESGVWAPILTSEELYVFGCARNRKYNNLLLNRCRQALEAYDGVMADCIGFPLPSLGLEMQFSCFCPVCLRDEPRLESWRKRVFELREALMSASDADLERWGTFRGILEDFGLGGLFEFRRRSIAELTAQYAEMAKGMGKGFGLDVISPAMSLMSGHDYAILGNMADWIKPRLYLRTYGPSTIPMELHALTMGMKAWGRRYSIPGVLALIERSTGFEMPANIHRLEHDLLSPSLIARELKRARGLTPCPIHPGIELSMHFEFGGAIDATTVKSSLEKTLGSPGVVLCWNLAYISDDHLRLVGDITRS